MKSLGQGGALSAMVLVCAFVATVQQASAQTLPSGWSSRDINTSGGSATSSGGTWTVSGSGANIWDAADAFQFTYRSISGDFDFSARLTAFDAANSWSKAGLMVRESLNANARNAYTMFAPGTGPGLQYRATTGGTTARIEGTGSPSWLRLVRQGTRFTAYTSADGSSWSTVGSTTMTMGSAVYIGLAVTARSTSAFAEATFSSMRIDVPAEAATADPWSSVDIGSPSLAGTYSAVNGTYTIAAAGDEIWGTSDQFRYAYQTVTGDVEIIARVSSLQVTNEWAQAGVMIRQSTNPGAPNAMMSLSASRGYWFQRRASLAASTYDDYAGAGAAPGWIRLTREGNVFSAYYSTNGTNWTLAGTDTFNLGSTVLVGLAVASHTTSTRTTATFTNVTVRTPTAGTNQPPSVTLTAPAAGASYTAPATVAMSASASDADGNINRVEFYRGSTLVASDTTSPYSATWSNAAAGSYSLTAVAYDNDGASTTSPAVNVTVGTGTTNQAPAVSFVSPSAGQTFVAPAEIYIEATATDADGIERVDLYQGSTLLKSDYSIPFSHRLIGVAAGTHQLTATAYDDLGQSRTVTLSVTVSNSTGNQMPTASITSPATGASYAAPATVNVAASASDADGNISRVEFYRDSTLISTDTTSPYNASWTNAPAGSYALTVRAYDHSGGMGASAAVNVTVGSSTNQPPTVSITSPASGASYPAPASMTMTATAADADGSVAGVDFYVGTQLVGSDSSSPYTASWTNVPAGTYSLTARARDNAGATRTSSAVSITVGVTAARPATLAFNASTNHSTAVNSYVVAIYRSVDPVTASPVATRDLGKPTPVSGVISVDITTLVSPLGTGSFYAVVRAVGSSGTTASTASSTFTN